MVDKVSNDVEAPATGVLHVLVPEEQPVRQGEVIATIGT
jgi:pyruvate/2-oxoglutarate dehydrogenase complex dihydrolipoamide acyltransferase (E2) component